MFQAKNFSISKSTASGQQPAGAMWASGYTHARKAVCFSPWGCHTPHLMPVSLRSHKWFSNYRGPASRCECC